MQVTRTHKPKAWTVEEARLFLERARSDDDPLYVGYVFILMLGLRRDEVLGLEWADVDLDAGEVRISWQLQRIGGQLLHRQTKTEASDAPLPCRTSAPRL
jgi:integrase